MNTFVIYRDDVAVGVADYLDEAQECAERMAGNPSNTYWQPLTGKMYILNNLTDWRVARFDPTSVLERAA